MKKPLKAIASFAFLVYILLIVSLLFFRNRYAGGLSIAEYMSRFSNFVPFKTIKMYVTYFFAGKINKGIVYRNIFGNVLLFMPFSAFLYCLFPKMRNLISNLSVVLFCILTTEVVQLLFKIGSIDIDDVILNMLGAFLGFLIVNASPFRMFVKKNM